jgi:hypothetical protein
VTLVDTNGRGVEHVTPSGVVVDGVEYALDCPHLRDRGFEVGTAYTAARATRSTGATA